MKRLLTGLLREADPIQAGQLVDFEQREADPSRYSITHNIHSVDDMTDNATAPYDGAQMPGAGAGGAMPPDASMAGAPGGAPPPDDQLQDMNGMPPGGGPQAQPPMPGQMQEHRLNERGFGGFHNFGGLMPHLQQMMQPMMQPPPQRYGGRYPGAGYGGDPGYGNPGAAGYGGGNADYYGAGAGGVLPSNMPSGARSAVGAVSQTARPQDQNYPYRRWPQFGQSPGAPPSGGPRPGAAGAGAGSGGGSGEGAAAAPVAQSPEFTAALNTQFPRYNINPDSKDFLRLLPGAKPMSGPGSATALAAPAAAGAPVVRPDVTNPAKSGPAMVSTDKPEVPPSAAPGVPPAAAVKPPGPAATTGVAPPAASAGRTKPPVGPDVPENPYNKYGDPGSWTGKYNYMQDKPVSHWVQDNIPIVGPALSAAASAFNATTGSAQDWANQIKPSAAASPQTTGSKPVGENAMKDNFDLFLDDLLRIDEAPPTRMAPPRDPNAGGSQGRGPVSNTPRNYAGYTGAQQAPASIAASGPQAVRNWQAQMQQVGGASSAGAPATGRAGGGGGGGAARARPAGGGSFAGGLSAVPQYDKDLNPVNPSAAGRLGGTSPGGTGTAPTGSLAQTLGNEQIPGRTPRPTGAPPAGGGFNKLATGNGPTQIPSGAAPPTGSLAQTLGNEQIPGRRPPTGSLAQTLGNEQVPGRAPSSTWDPKTRTATAAIPPASGLNKLATGNGPTEIPSGAPTTPPATPPARTPNLVAGGALGGPRPAPTPSAPATPAPSAPATGPNLVAGGALSPTPAAPTKTASNEAKDWKMSWKDFIMLSESEKR